MSRKLPRRTPLLSLPSLGGLTLALSPLAASAAPPPRTPLSPLPPMLAQAEQLPEVPKDLQPDAAPDEAKDGKELKQQGAAASGSPAAGDKAVCETDEQCGKGSICAEGACKVVRHDRISALFYFHQQGPRGYRLVVPFYFSFWTPQKSSRLLLPLFYNARETLPPKDGQPGGERRNLALFPLLYQYVREPGYQSHRVWPIFFYNNYGERGSGAGLLPLFYAERRADRSLTILPPLLSFHRRAGADSDLLLGGVAYVGRRGPSTSVIIPPLLTFVKHGADGGGGMILALGWYRQRGEALSAGVFPLIWHSSDAKGSTTVGVPLFLDVHDRERRLRHTTLLPFFHYRRERDEDGKEARLLITPLGGWARDHHEDTSTLATVVPPLVYRDEPRRRLTVVPPLALFYRNKELATSAGYVGPIFWSRDDRGSTSGLFPLYTRFHNGAATTHILFPVAALHRSPERSFGFLGPLYGWSRRGADPAGGGGLLPVVSFATGRRSHFLLLPPLFMYLRDQDAQVTSVNLGPLYLRRRGGDHPGWHAGLFPLLALGSSGGAEGPRSYQALLPLFFHSRTPREERLVLGPLYYQRDQQARSTRGGLFPLLSLHHSPERGHAVLAPIFWYARRGEERVWVAGPFFQQTRPGERTLGLFPLFYAHGSAQRRLLVTPLGGYYQNRPEQVSAAVVGPFFHHRRGDEVVDALLPLFASYRSPRQSATLLFPLFLQVRQGESRYHTAAFLWHRYQRPGLSLHALLPLFVRMRSERASLLTLGPLFTYHRHDDSARAFGLAPLLAYARDERRALLVTPLGFYHKNQQTGRSRTWFGGLFYGDFQAQRSDFGLIPLFFAGRRGSSHSLALPLLLTYHSHDHARGQSTTVVGPVYVAQRGAANFFGLAPVLFGSNDGRGGFQVTLAPLLHYSQRADRSRLLTPAFGYGKSASGGFGYLGPFYVRRDADQRSEAVLPLFYHGRNLRTGSSTTMVLPLFFRSTAPGSTLTAVTPLFWQHNTLTRRVLFGFPLALDVHRLYQDRLTAVGPLVPLFVRYRNEAERTTSWVFPPLLTYVQRKLDGTHDAVAFPLLWHFGGHERQTTVVLPLFYHLRRPSYQATVLFPLLGHVRDDEGARHTLIPPLLTYFRTEPNGNRFATVFPLFWHSRRPERTLTVLFPLVAHWRTPRGHYTVVLNQYIYKGTGAYQGTWDYHFWPLFSVGRPRRQDLEWNILGGVVGYSRLGINRNLRLLWGIQVPLEPVGQRSAWYGATLRMSSGY